MQCRRWHCWTPDDGMASHPVCHSMDYLVKRGVPSNLIVTEGRGSLAPVTTNCSQDDRDALIACLAPDRRVEIVVIGHG